MADCVICGTELPPPPKPSRAKKTCSRACTNKMVWRNTPNRAPGGPKPRPRVIADCAWCGMPVKWAQRPGRQGIYCSRTCAGQAKTRGGLDVRDDGRTRIHCRDNTKVYYYRAVMEAHIGRELRPDEEVHHINGDTTDDRIENLLLLSTSEHRRLHGALITATGKRHAREQYLSLLRVTAQERGG